MVTRRTMLLGTFATLAAARIPTSLAKASQPATAVNFDVPPGACDCHTHIHGDPRDFPWFAGRVYTPEMALPDEMAALHKALRIQRVVIVTPSVYGTDNSATLYGMKARGRDARGVAVIDDKTPESELDSMHAAGVRGIRLNLATGGTNDPSVGRARLKAALERMSKRGWHVQMFTSLAMISAAKDLVASAPVPVVFDHFGGAAPEKGVDQPGFADLIELVRSGKAYVKISITAGPRPDYSIFAPLARALVAANPDRVIWGTNWPHPNSSSGKPAMELTPLFQVDDGLVMNHMAAWLPEPAIRKKVLVDNPARLYDFPAI
jgi:predicted TIM-barrel fold metal-dependent hydrolase